MAVAVHLDMARKSPSMGCRALYGVSLEDLTAGWALGLVLALTTLDLVLEGAEALLGQHLQLKVDNALAQVDAVVEHLGEGAGVSSREVAGAVVEHAVLLLLLVGEVAHLHGDDLGAVDRDDPHVLHALLSGSSVRIERPASKVCRLSAIVGMLRGTRARVRRERGQLAEQDFVSRRGIGASNEFSTSTGSYLGVGVLNASLQRWGMLVIGHAGAGDRPMPECIQTNDDERRLHRLPYLSHSNRCAMLVSTLQ